MEIFIWELALKVIPLLIILFSIPVLANRVLTLYYSLRTAHFHMTANLAKETMADAIAKAKAEQVNDMPPPNTTLHN